MTKGKPGRGDEQKKRRQPTASGARRTIAEQGHRVSKKNSEARSSKGEGHTSGRQRVEGTNRKDFGNRNISFRDRENKSNRREGEQPSRQEGGGDLEDAPGPARTAASLRRRTRSETQNGNSPEKGITSAKTGRGDEGGQRRPRGLTSREKKHFERETKKK